MSGGGRGQASSGGSTASPSSMMPMRAMTDDHLEQPLMEHAQLSTGSSGLDSDDDQRGSPFSRRHSKLRNRKLSCWDKCRRACVKPFDDQRLEAEFEIFTTHGACQKRNPPRISCVKCLTCNYCLVLKNVLVAVLLSPPLSMYGTGRRRTVLIISLLIGLTATALCLMIVIGTVSECNATTLSMTPPGLRPGAAHRPGGNETLGDDVSAQCEFMLQSSVGELFIAIIFLLNSCRVSGKVRIFVHLLVVAWLTPYLLAWCSCVV